MNTLEPDIKTADVDGIPTWWIDAPRPYTAALMFRVGSFDEPLRMRGVSHLVEHLALYPLRDTELTFNGVAGTHTTIFWAQGHPDRVGDFLRRVCVSIHDLPYDRLHVESSVLQREAAETTKTAAVNQILWSYFGPFGPGLVGSDEVGLSWLGPEALSDWANRYFTFSNAALALTGPPPKSWHLSLPLGVSIPYRVPERIRPAPTEPTLFDTQTEGVTWGAMIRDSKNAVEPPMPMSLDILSRRLQERLRHDLGEVYSVGNSWLRLDGDHVLVSLGFDADPEQSRQVGLEYHEVTTEYLESGPTVKEMERYVRGMERHYEDNPQEAARHHLVRAAEANLQDWGDPLALSEYRDACRSLTPEEVRARFEEAYRQSFTIADLPKGTLASLTGYSDLPDTPMKGVQFKSKFRHRQSQPSAVRVGPAGVDFAYADGWMSSPMEDIALVSFEGTKVIFHSARLSETVDSARYYQSRSRWLTRYAVWTAAALMLLAVLPTDWLARYTLPLFLLALLAESSGFRARRVASVPGLDEPEIHDRSLSMEQAFRMYVSEDLILPPPRSDRGSQASSQGQAL